jgi:hypothetical protein
MGYDLRWRPAQDRWPVAEYRPPPSRPQFRARRELWTGTGLRARNNGAPSVLRPPSNRPHRAERATPVS